MAQNLLRRTYIFYLEAKNLCEYYGLRTTKWVKYARNTVLRGGVGKSLARLTSRCRRAESIVSLERGVCSCAELQVFSCYRG